MLTLYPEKIVIKCPMYARYYPFDTQRCRQTYRSQMYQYYQLNVFAEPIEQLNPTLTYSGMETDASTNRALETHSV